ncbi:carbamate kinase [Isobaculum melis]|uniref:Carbamate kinase n=1 Tax=Isobaculum melis TaxID=142588 RepID=A0A1H9PNR6_9LACT|nr:carbamate kinase [Isobaculum melis]SER49465.1 carbamate kinase [Isobaculum melis]
MAKLVIALGGNALGQSVTEQKQSISKVVPVIADIIEEGHEVILTHGNGPQVGMIHLAFSNFSEENQTAAMPFAECNAMSEGYIGYHLQNALLNECQKRNQKKEVCTCITQVLVDQEDPAFQNPTKPIGRFYSKAEAEQLTQEKGLILREDAGRGYRQVVPSPKPQDIIEKESIMTLLAADKIVIACGGGGIPVIQSKEGLTGVEAVIDKDFSSEKLAELIGADKLIILTEVDQVYLNFGTKQQKALGKVSVSEVESYREQQHFKAGSMLPKVEAAIQFVKQKATNEAIITSIAAIQEALMYRNGTIIVEGGGN